MRQDKQARWPSIVSTSPGPHGLIQMGGFAAKRVVLALEYAVRDAVLAKNATAVAHRAS